MHLILKFLLHKINPKHFGYSSQVQVQTESHWYQFLLKALDFESISGVWDYSVALTLVWLNKNYRKQLF